MSDSKDSKQQPKPKPYRSAFRPDLYAGKVVFCTGGGSGIGMTIVEEMMRAGANAVIASRSLQRVQGRCLLLLFSVLFCSMPSHPSLQALTLHCIASLVWLVASEAADWLEKATGRCGVAIGYGMFGLIV